MEVCPTLLYIKIRNYFSMVKKLKGEESKIKRKCMTETHLRGRPTET